MPLRVHVQPEHKLIALVTYHDTAVVEAAVNATLVLVQFHYKESRHEGRSVVGNQVGNHQHWIVGSLPRSCECEPPHLAQQPVRIWNLSARLVMLSLVNVPSMFTVIGWSGNVSLKQLETGGTIHLVMLGEGQVVSRRCPARDGRRHRP